MPAALDLWIQDWRPLKTEMFQDSCFLNEVPSGMSSLKQPTNKLTI